MGSWIITYNRHFYYVIGRKGEQVRAFRLTKAHKEDKRYKGKVFLIHEQEITIVKKEVPMYRVQEF